MFTNSHSLAQRILLVFVAGLTTSSLAAVRAGEFKHISGNWDITNNSNSSANDFHVTVKHAGSAAVQIGNPNQFYNDGFFQQRTATASGGGGVGDDLILNLNWLHAGPGVINIGQTIHVGFEYESTHHSPEIVDAYWTTTIGTETTRNPGEQPKIPGFKVGSLLITNNSGSEMTVEDLNFLISPVAVPLAAMLPYTLGGFGTSSGPGTFVPTFTIPDGGAVDVTSYLPAQPNDDEFLLWQFRSYSTDTPTFTTEGMFQFQGMITAVPEPSTFVTLGGLLALGGIVRRRRSA